MIAPHIRYIVHAVDWSVICNVAREVEQVFSLKCSEINYNQESDISE